MRHLPLSRPLRQSWQYNNLCFNTAGYLIEVLTGQSWADAVRDLLLTPAGMTATVFDAHDPSIKAIAAPYKTVGDGVERQHLPERSKVGPAGGIVSSVEDLASWLQVRLGERPQVLSQDALAELHAPAMVGGVAAATAFDERQPMGYALGCQVESYRGRRIVRHGGNLVGYSSDVCVVPGAGIGIAVLANLHGTALRDALPLAIVDRLLELTPTPWGERYHALMTAGLRGKEDASEHHHENASRRPPSRDLEDFTGVYEHPAYGTFTIETDGQRLIPNFHGLGALHELRHRDYDAWDLFLVEFDQTLPLVFVQGSNGAISSLSVALEPLVDPICFPRAAPAASDDLIDAMVGTYTSGPLSLVIRRRGSDVVALLPGAGSLVLTSAGGTRFTSRDITTLSFEAQHGPDHAVTAMVIDPIGIFQREDDPHANPEQLAHAARSSS
ncbi:MAG: serine hydrolase [Actinobacteria bacterium]|nr:serine hydrolase [Actinomycetota bacterium]MCA1722490.1 serine hydrolase [Actinomycetota bacterium]